MEIIILSQVIFGHIKHELTKDPQAQWIAQIGGGKGKVSIHFLRKRIAKISNYLEIKIRIDKQQLDENELIKVAVAKNFGCQNLLSFQLYLYRYKYFFL